MIAAGGLGAVVTLFAVLNLDDVDVNWIFGTASTPLIVVILLCVALGMAIDRALVHRGRRASRRGGVVQAHATELDDVPVAQLRVAHPHTPDDDAVERAVVEDAGAVAVAHDHGVTARDRRVVEREARCRAAADVQDARGHGEEDDLGAVLDREVLADLEGGMGAERVTALALGDDSGGRHEHSPHRAPERDLTSS